MTALAAARARAGGGLGEGFWRLWSASVGANLSDGVFQIALPLLAISLTDSPVLVAGVAVASRLPWLFFALVAGALADRLDRRRTMIVVDIARVVLLGLLAVAALAGAATIWLLYIVAFGLGILETLFDTAAQSILPNVVLRERLATANSRLLTAEFSMNQFIGPPLGGLIAAGALAAAFGAAAVGYLAAALFLVGLRGSFRPAQTGPPTRIHEEIGEGLRYLFRHPLLRPLAITIGLINLAQGAAFAILVLYAVEPGPVGLSEVGFGLLLTVNAVGLIVGTLLAGQIDRRLGKPNLLLASILVLALATAVLTVTTNAFAIGAAYAFGGVFLGAFNVTFQSLRQRVVPDRILGRVVASFRMLGWGALPLGAAFGGVIGETLGLTAVFAAATVATLLLVPIRLVVTDGLIARAEAEADADRAAIQQRPAGAG